MKKVYIETMGCQMNKSDTERMLGMLSSFNYEETSEARKSRLAYGKIPALSGSLAKIKAFSLIGTWGKWKQSRPDLGKNRFLRLCCTTESRRNFKRAPYVDFILGTHKIYSLPEIIKQVECGDKVCECTETNATEDDKAKDFNIKRVKSMNAWINITEGCNNFLYILYSFLHTGKRTFKTAGNYFERSSGCFECRI